MNFTSINITFRYQCPLDSHITYFEKKKKIEDNLIEPFLSCKI